jgi:hypothetical protein
VLLFFYMGLGKSRCIYLRLQPKPKPNWLVAASGPKKSEAPRLAHPLPPPHQQPITAGRGRAAGRLVSGGLGVAAAALSP